MSKPKTIAEICVESQLLIERLLKASEGDVVTYDEMTALIGRDVRNGAYHCMRTARNRLERDHQIVFQPVLGVGLKRCNDREKVEVGMHYTDRIKSAARSGARKLGSVHQYDSLSKEKKTQHNAYLSIYGVMIEMTRARKVEAITAKVAETQSKLPLSKMLEAMR